MSKRLIVNADDYGRTAGVVEGILRAHQRGIVTSTTAMMNMPGIEDALRRAQSYPELGLGVHLVFSNLKTWLTGQFHGVSAKYLPAYLAEFSYRFNRRRKPEDIFGWVIRRLMRREPRTMDDIQMAGLSA